LPHNVNPPDAHTRAPHSLVLADSPSSAVEGPHTREQRIEASSNSGLVGMSDVTFEPSTHTYRINGVIAQSVTQVIARLKRQFESERVAKLVAQRDGKSVEQVLLEWKQKSDIALANGRALHEAAEAVMLGRTHPSTTSPNIQAWLKFWRVANTSMKPQMTESIVADSVYMVAGTLDALLFSEKTRQQHVFDWKTGKFLLKNSWGEMLLPPFDDIPACQLTIYSLQVSLYRLILERHGIPCGTSWILHCSNVATPYRAFDFRDRLHEWLSSGSGCVKHVIVPEVKT